MQVLHGGLGRTGWGEPPGLDGESARDGWQGSEERVAGDTVERSQCICPGS